MEAAALAYKMNMELKKKMNIHYNQMVHTRQQESEPSNK
jgi:hypothetical protein